MTESQVPAAEDVRSSRREHVRLVPSRPEEFSLVVRAEGEDVSARLIDYSPFGMGALVPATPRNRELFAAGRVYALSCTFGASCFPSRGRVAGTGEVSERGEPWLRVGFSLVSEATPTREKLSQRRGDLRLETDAHLAPLAVCDDELWFGDRIFMRVRDVSAGGLALELPSDRVPFLPKQRLWLRFVIPFLGDFRASVRGAYVRPLTPGHLIGVTFLRSVSDISHVLCDYLSFTHPEFDREELRAAGFDVSHLPRSPDAPRARIVTSHQGEAWRDETLEFLFEDARGETVGRGAVRFLAGGSRLEVVSLEGESPHLTSAFLRFLLPLADLHASEEIALTQSVRATLAHGWKGAPDRVVSPAGLIDTLPLRQLVAIVPLFLRRLRVPHGSQSLAIQALALAQSAPFLRR